jgi:hypothetical protein
MTYRPQGGPATQPYADFRRAVRLWVQSRDTARKDLATAFEVGQSAVDGWWIGTATPHPTLQDQVLAWISSRHR